MDWLDVANESKREARVLDKTSSFLKWIRLPHLRAFILFHFTIIYMVISKVISRILKPILSNSISNEQFGWLPL